MAGPPQRRVPGIYGDTAVGEDMSQSKSLGPAAGAAATLPVTGSNTALMVAAGVALVVVGLLLMRAARVRRARA